MQNNMSRAIINALEKNLDEDKLIKAIENIIHNKLQNITLAQQKTGKPDKEDHTWLDDLSI
jgi:UDP-N-acetylglucosamine:LPS N-acetylglucosamine transferase